MDDKSILTTLVDLESAGAVRAINAGDLPIPGQQKSNLAACRQASRQKSFRADRPFAPSVLGMVSGPPGGLARSVWRRNCLAGDGSEGVALRGRAGRLDFIGRFDREAARQTISPARRALSVSPYRPMPLSLLWLGLLPGVL
jgi:hypothetical protein